MKSWYKYAFTELKDNLEHSARINGLEFLEDFVLKYRDDYFESIEFDDVDKFVSEEFDAFQSWLKDKNSHDVTVGQNGKWYSSSVKVKKASQLKVGFNLSEQEEKLLKPEALWLHGDKVAEYRALYNKLAATNYHDRKFRCAYRLAKCAELNREVLESELVQYWLNASDSAVRASMLQEASECKCQAAYHCSRIANHAEAAKLYEEAYELVKASPVEGKMQLLKNSRIQYQLFGDHEAASKIFSKEKELEYKESSNSKKIALFLFFISSNYGESPRRVILNSFVVLCISTLLAYGMGITALEDNGSNSFSELARSAYFSVVTFTTLGYGDFYPKSLCGQLFSSILAIVGLIYTSVFMVTVVRKYART